MEAVEESGDEDKEEDREIAANTALNRSESAIAEETFEWDEEAGVGLRAFDDGV